MFGVTLGFALSKLQEFAFDVLGGVADDLLDTLEQGATSIFKFIVIVLYWTNELWIGLIFNELTDLCKSTGNTLVQLIEGQFGNMTSLDFLAYIIGLGFLVFIIKQICKFIGSLL